MAVKIHYDAETDSLVIELRPAAIRESDEISPNVIADFGWDGEVVGFEVLRASTFVELPEPAGFERPAHEARTQ
jgi:uncharacterized protein YuzE